MQGKAQIASLDKRDKFVRLQIDFPANATDNVKIGASVAINGTCLTACDHPGGLSLKRHCHASSSRCPTLRLHSRHPNTPQVTEQMQSTLCFDVIEETLRVTNLGRLEKSSTINFERSAK